MEKKKTGVLIPNTKPKEKIPAINAPKTKEAKELIRKSWNKWDVIASGGVVMACVLFYIYFW